MGIVKVVVGGFFGSCGKGAIAAHLSRPDELGGGIAIRVGGSNAGHTAVDREGRRWPLRHIPVAAAVNPDCDLALAAGSEIDLDVLSAEIQQLEAAGIATRGRLYIDPNATIVTQDHKNTEERTGLTSRVGSTAKGIGAARAERIFRTTPTVRDWEDNGVFAGPEWTGVKVTDVAALARAHLREIAGVALVEGTQGYGLGLHTRFYPYTTSGDCRAVDVLAQAGISPWDGNDLEVYVVYRPNPIRVAGNSGPLHGETTWEALGLPPEQTTVTQKTRRVGAWDPQLARESWLANGGEEKPGPRRLSRESIVYPVLAMADHLIPEVAGLTNLGTTLTDDQQNHVERLWKITEPLEEAFTGSEFCIYGTGPSSVLDYR